MKQYVILHKGCCHENASSINLKCNEIFTKVLPKNLKDFANRRQVKHTSTILESQFHTLVKLVDAENIANNKIRTHAFVQVFKKQFSSQKNAYSALNLTEKDNEAVRHCALRVQQLFEKGWCNEKASTIKLKCNEIFTKGLPKTLLTKDK